MIDFFDDMAFGGTARKSELLNRFYIYAVARRLSIICANFLLPIWFKCTGGCKANSLNKNIEPADAKYIVSLTTFPLRIKSVYLVIESMLRQKLKPDMIILYLSKEQFSGKEVLPQKLLDLTDRGLQIKFVDDDLRSHKKYLYAMKNYPEANIITVDDDVIYRSDFIESFVELSKKFPGCIIGNRCKVTSSVADCCYNAMRDARCAMRLPRMHGFPGVTY